MPSEKVARILLARSELGEAQVAALSEAEAWRQVYSLPKPARGPTRVVVCFTGFSALEKEELEALALQSGDHVTASVTKKLGLLVCGDNAGPSKLEKAAVQGVTLVTGPEYRQLVRESRTTDAGGGR
jgi:DNA ligase (NAD+)